MNLSNIRAIVFDRDGVRLNSNQAKRNALYSIVSPFGAGEASAFVEYDPTALFVPLILLVGSLFCSCSLC